MLRRRQFLALALGAPAIMAATAYLYHHDFRAIYRSSGLRQSILQAVRETVSKDLSEDHIADFLSYILPKLKGLDLRTESFKRRVCTEFIVNSNLPENGFDVAHYRFVMFSGVCNPFRAQF